ncbi:MAG: hypothetical protein C4324_00930 [Blastocatellia bacterium]
MTKLRVKVQFIITAISSSNRLPSMSLRKWQSIYLVAAFALLPAAPLLYLQGRFTRWKVGVLPDAENPEGIAGDSGDEDRLLVIGESTVAGLGAKTHDRALAGRFAFWLSQVIGRRIRWRAIGRTGVTARETLDDLFPLISQEETFDYILVGLGGNDVLKITSPKRFRRDMTDLLARLRERFPQATIFISNCPMIKFSPVLPQPIKGILWRLSKMHDANMRDLTVNLEGVHYYPQPTEFEVDGFFADGIHPSEKGYDDWSRAMTEYFASRLPR